MVERNQDMAYMDLIRKLEKRFGFRELPETAQVQFNNARQTPEELMEDWVDRVLERLDIYPKRTCTNKR